MFIWTARLPRKRVAAGVIAAAFLCGAALTASSFFRGRETEASAAVSPKGVRTNEDRVAYLASYGWTVTPDPVSVEELVIPEEFEDTYTQYVDLQASQGFDLTRYCGKRVKRYTYTVTNYPSGESGVLAGLLIYRNTVIGGDVLSTDLGGFIHGLARPG